MTIFCKPYYVLIAFALAIVLVPLFPKVLQSLTGEDFSSDDDWGKWILIGLSLVAIVSLGVYLIFTFTHFGRLAILGC